METEITDSIALNRPRWNKTISTDLIEFTNDDIEVEMPAVKKATKQNERTTHDNQQPDAQQFILENQLPMEHLEFEKYHLDKELERKLKLRECDLEIKRLKAKESTNVFNNQATTVTVKLKLRLQKITSYLQVQGGLVHLSLEAEMCGGLVEPNRRTKCQGHFALDCPKTKTQGGELHP